MINFWLAVSNTFDCELLAIELNGSCRTLSRLNRCHSDTMEVIDGALVDYGSLPNPFVSEGGIDIRNCYTRRRHDVHAIRKDFTELAAAYPKDFRVLGAWHFEGAANGKGLELGTRWENGGLRGAPWFIQPPGVEMYTANADASRVPLVAGQAPRMI